ncbi:MAG: hypothetical protein HY721_22525 [Planctomycetes bacterium]|nr:hypothetical protein [Planctomycetota bacterium]
MRPFYRSSLLVVGTIAVSFGAYELVERAWLADADPSFLRALHIVRGAGTSVLVAALVAWSLLKTSRPLMAQRPPGKEWPPWGEPTDEDKVEHCSRWFIRMRWIAVLTALTLSYVAVGIAGVLPAEVWWPLLATVASLAALNVAFSLLTRRRIGLRYLLLLQAYCDLAVLAALLHFSGGIENPFALLTFFHVIISGILMPRRQCYRVAAAASVLLAALAWAEWSGVLAHYSLHVSMAGEGGWSSSQQTLYVASWTGLLCAFLFLAAYFVTTVADRARADERRLEALADRALAERQLLEQALETTGAGLRVVSRSLEDRIASRRWREWFPPAAPATPSEREDVAVGQTFEDGAVRTTEVSRNGTGGDSRAAPADARVLQLTTAPLLDRSGKITEVVQLARDVTQQKKAQDQLLQAGRLSAVGELAGHVAHEVNNPLSVIGLKARLLLSDRRGEMSETVAGEIEKIVHCSDRVARIARGLLSYCRPTGSRRAPMDLLAPIRKAKAMIEERARASRVEIEERLEGPVPRVHANEAELEQVFLNLFLNALDAMPGGGKLTVEAGRGCENLPGGCPCACLTVEDTGIGIPEDLQGRIFEPFFSTKEKGTGLGLSICLGLLKGHGGDIAVESELGKGSRFTVRLPAAPRGCPEQKELRSA